MRSSALVVLRGTSPVLPSISKGCFLGRLSCCRRMMQRGYSVRSSLEPPDVARLAETARISLTPQQVEQFGPKIQQVVDWAYRTKVNGNHVPRRFGQLQAVDLDSVEPAIRAGTEGENLREDVAEVFANREGIIAAIPSYQEPYVKVPKVLNKE